MVVHCIHWFALFENYVLYLAGDMSVTFAPVLARLALVRVTHLRLVHVQQTLLRALFSQGDFPALGGGGRPSKVLILHMLDSLSVRNNCVDIDLLHLVDRIHHAFLAAGARIMLGSVMAYARSQLFGRKLQRLI